MSGFHVLKPGAMTTVQDLGRFGYQDIGLTTGGCMDEHAAGWANRLLGNKPQCALLEVSLGNMQLQAEVDTWIAVTGAEQQFSINNRPQNNWQSHFVKAGDILAFSWSKTGVRSYLAVVGGFELQPQFGSCSTVVRESVGGIEGRALQSGDHLSCAASEEDLFSCNRAVPAEFIPDYSDSPIVDVVLGYQQHSFSKKGLQQFFKSDYQIKPDSDRMGYRLDGEALNPNVQGIFSEGICFGAIQVPADGFPIILLKDRQTLGGYPKLGAVVTTDAFRLSQCRPGQTVSFREVSLEFAQNKVRAFYQFFS